jgi:hypothetical protein
MVLQWAAKLVNVNVMTSTTKMISVVKELCLDGPCSKNAVAAVVSLNMKLYAFEVSKQFLEIE